jgi:hypothetical protein
MGNLAAQVTGAIFFIWKELPAFKQLLLSPGVQPPNIPLRMSQSFQFDGQAEQRKQRTEAR